MPKVVSTDIPAVKIIEPKRFGDSRGFFVESWNRRRLLEAAIDLDFVQDNESFSVQAGTVRGLHFQKHPNAQDKLVRVLAGRVVDVAVDIRRGSPTYGKHVAVELSAENGRQLLIPIGFAHGFCTLEPNTLIAYKVTAHYSPADDLGIAWNDPDLAISWPVSAKDALLSDKDLRQPAFADLPAYFEWAP
jgi:dTDP-4-dehydrorhamnose 3,5-epimerase